MEKKLAMSLGKLILATAWADGELQAEEIEILQSVILRLPELSKQERTILKLYSEFPISDEEQECILNELKTSIKNDKDREFALSVIKSVVEADGEITENEKQLFHKIKSRLEDSKANWANVTARVRKLFSSSSITIESREADLEQYLDNPVFYALKKRVTTEPTLQKITIGQLESISIYAMLMVTMAKEREPIHPNESIVIESDIVCAFRIHKKAAAIITEIALNHPISSTAIPQYCELFLKTNSKDQCLKFYNSLLQLMKSTGHIAESECLLLKHIATHINLDSKFIKEHTPSPS